MKKRLMALALCGAMGASLLTGCGSSTKETAAATTAAAATEAAKTEAATTAAATEAAKKEAKGSVYYLNFKPEQDAQ